MISNYNFSAFSEKVVFFGMYAIGIQIWWLINLYYDISVDDQWTICIIIVLNNAHSLQGYCYCSSRTAIFTCCAHFSRKRKWQRKTQKSIYNTYTWKSNSRRSGGALVGQLLHFLQWKIGLLARALSWVANFEPSKKLPPTGSTNNRASALWQLNTLKRGLLDCLHVVLLARRGHQTSRNQETTVT